MSNKKIGLTRKHWEGLEGYIFPDDVFMIPGMDTFGDFQTIFRCALQKMEQYRGENIDLYISGGLSSELLETVRAAAELNIQCNLYYFDTNTWKYVEVPQKLIWKPQEKKENQPAVAFSLCANRHDQLNGMESIYEEITEEQMFDFAWMEERAERILMPYRNLHMKLYLTGLSQAYISVLNVAARCGISVTAMIYDYNEEDYAELEMDERLCVL